jgi:murein DD-endopeptidase MepM/ murein hydrolase activator NlpD
MDIEKQIRILLSENEFLQHQLEDLNKAVKQRDEEILFLGDNMDSAAELQSRIDSNLAEIEQLKYNNALTEEKAAAAEELNEALENDLLQQIRQSHKDEKLLQEMNSVKVNLDVANEELEQSAGFYQRIIQLKKEVAELKSNLELSQSENELLKEENEELQQLITLLRQKRLNE